MSNKINNSSLKAIYNALEETFFGAPSFKIETSESFLARLTYLDNSSYCFLFGEDYAGLFVDYSPGEVKTSARTRIKSLEDCCNYVKLWAENICAELKSANPLYDELAKARAEFAEKLNAHVGDPTMHFLPDEVEQLRRKFDDLVTKFDELRKQNEITEKELKEVTEIVVSLKQALGEMPKKSWFRCAGNKLIDLGSQMLKSKQGQELIKNVGSRLLTDVTHPPA